MISFLLVALVNLTACGSVPKSETYPSDSAVQRQVAALSPGQGNPQLVAQVIQELASIVSSKAKKIQKGFAVFNYSSWENPPQFGEDDHFYDKALARAQETLSHFWGEDQTGHEGDFYGSGLYAALDPIVTMGYGVPQGVDQDAPSFRTASQPFHLRAISLEPDLVYFNMDDDALFPPATFRKIRSLGCPFDKEVGHLSVAGMLTSYGPTGGPKHAMPRICRHVMLEALRKAQVQIIFYGYQGASADLKGCTQNFSTAAVVIDPNLITASRLHFYFPQIANEDPLLKERLEIERIARLFSNDPHPEKISLWPNLQVDTNDQNQDWMKEHLVNCQPQRDAL